MFTSLFHTKIGMYLRIFSLKKFFVFFFMN